MISFTITEKGYALYRPDGSLMPVVQADIDEGPAHARHAMSMVAACCSSVSRLVPPRWLLSAWTTAPTTAKSCSPA